MDKERPKKQRKADGVLDWEDYYSVDEIYAWVDSIQQEFPTWITVEDIGYSHEGRVMKVVKLSKKQVLKISPPLTFLSLTLQFFTE